MGAQAENLDHLEDDDESIVEGVTKETAEFASAALQETASAYSAALHETASASSASGGKSVFRMLSDSVSEGISSISRTFTSVFKSEFQLERVIARAEQFYASSQWAEGNAFLDRALRQFCETQLKGPFANEASSEALFQKLKIIIMDVDYGVSPEVLIKAKTELCETVVRNFNQMQEEVLTRAARDFKKTEFIDKFGLAEGDTIASVELLGDETHNHGRIPARIRFTSGAEVIYKPRSMHVENTLYNRENGICTIAGLGSYSVMCESDDSGEYGYSEFLHNEKEANTFSDPQDLVEYYQKLSKLELIAQELGITDLHLLNVIVKDKVPYIIDAEVYLNPEQEENPFETLLFSKEHGAAYYFDLDIRDGSGIGNNRLWFAGEIGEKLGHPKRIRDDDLRDVGVDLESIRPSVRLTEEEKGACAEAKATLARRPGRFVPVSTRNLKLSLRCINPESDEQLGGFIEHELARNLKDYGMELIFPKPYTHLAELIKEDFLNNDVPSFNYDSRSDVVIYKGEVIARRSTEIG